MGKLTYHDFFLQNWSKFFGQPPKQKPFIVVYPDEARPRHSVLFGVTGAGKTRVLIPRAIQDAVRRVTGWSNRGFAILSPHPDFFCEVRDRLALLALEYPEIYDLVYIIDPTNEAWSVKYNLLERRRLRPGESIEARADEVARLFALLYGDDINIHVWQQRCMANTFLALSLGGLSLVHAPKFLREPKYREGLVARLGYLSPRLIGFWLKEFQQRRDKMDLIGSTMNRLERFIYTHQGIEFMLEGPSTFDFFEILNQGAILLVNGNKGKLKAASNLFLGFIMHGLQDAAMERLDMDEDERIPFTVYADEGQTFVTDTIKEVITESRKVKFDLLFATQTPKSLTKNPELQEIILGVAGNVMAMRLGRSDAEFLAKELFTPEIVQEKIVIDGRPVFMSLPEVWEMETRKLSELPDRMIWWKRRGYPGAQLIRALTVRDIDTLPGYDRLDEARQRLEMAAFKLAGRRKLKRLPAPRPGSRPGGTRGRGLHWTR
jgi:hypothetical protein